MSVISTTLLTLQTWLNVEIEDIRMPGKVVVEHLSEPPYLFRVIIMITSTSDGIEWRWRKKK